MLPVTQDELDEWCERHGVPWHAVARMSEQERTAVIRERDEC